MTTSVLLYLAVLLGTGLLFGKVAKYLKLPNVTGYLVGGLILGPSILNIIPEGTIHDFSIISSVALGFIAFSIGTEMKLVYFRRVGATPIWIAIFEALFAVIVTLIAVLGYFLIKGDLSLTNFRFALVLSAIAAATAPAATIMVVRQYKAKGKLTETLLSVVAIDDSVAIILFGIFVAVANALGQTAVATPLWLQILNPFIELIVSLAIGSVMGIILTLGCKWFTGRGNRISLSVAIIFLSIFLAEWLHASPLLTAMMLGAVFGNVSSKAEDINGLLYFITPPIFILFFVLSGAELNISILGVVGIIGLVYVVFRVVGKIFGAWLGAKVTKAEPVIAKYLGYALVPQAGVAIGLSLIATQVLNVEMGSQIRAIILAGTLIYELVGPVITKMALKKAGEISIEA
ncbi:MAG: sodium:proton exchanger [Tenericutes bacterium RIFOXYD2_FULL_35_11]|nr:MAG: sodium:proton exchanger [Tenericutes bacterium RIFOXYD2_FULL_35_11]